jgi:hypothetical protein
MVVLAADPEEDVLSSAVRIAAVFAGRTALWDGPFVREWRDGFLTGMQGRQPSLM